MESLPVPRSDWSPAIGEHLRGVPETGTLVAFADRTVFRVMEVGDADWDDDDRQRYEWTVSAYRPGERYRRALPGDPPAPGEWRDRPRLVLLRPVQAGPEYAGKIGEWRCVPHRMPYDIYVLPEHYAVCAVCGEPAPCVHLRAQQQAGREMERLEVLEKRLPGCCWACGEPVTSRTRKWIAFDGGNLDLPTGHSPVVFHLRLRCLGAAREYERRWVAAEKGRRWRLQCHGRFVMHVDGPDCSEGVLCPGPDAEHRSFDDHRGGFGNVRCLRCVDARGREAARPGE